MSSLSDALGALSLSLKSVAGTSVTFRRGSLSVEITATRAQARYQQDDQAFGVNRQKFQDWIVAAADLVLDSRETKPARHDVIEVTENSRTYKYKVLGGSGVPEWEPVDQNGVMLRIHTELHSEVAA